MTTYHRGIAAIGWDQRRPPGRQGFIEYTDGTTLWFKNVGEAERYAKGGPKPSDGEQVPAGEGYCVVPNCSGASGSPCPKFVPDSTGTNCNDCSHPKTKHTGKAKAKAKVADLNFAELLQALS